jgi:hypothetical protein
VSPVKYELGSYIQEDGILHSDRRENLKCYITPFHLQSVTLESANSVQQCANCVQQCAKCVQQCAKCVTELFLPFFMGTLAIK